MNSKEYLKQYLPLQEELNHLMEEINISRANLLLPKVIPTNGASKVKSNKSRIEFNYEFIEDLKNQYSKKLKEMTALRKKIEGAIEALELKEKILIRYRYFNGMVWKDIAMKIGYEEAQIHRIHNKALKKLDRILKLTNE